MSARAAAVSGLTITSVLLVSVIAGAGAQGAAKTVPMFATGKILRTWCLGKGAVRAHCAGYVAGVVDGLRDGSAPGAVPACLPSKLGVEQVRLLVLNHLHRHPQHEGRAASTLVREALADAFPCAPPPDRPAPVPGRERISSAPAVSATVFNELPERTLEMSGLSLRSASTAPNPSAGGRPSFWSAR